MPYVVYCHTSPSGKKYVGCTSTQITKRFRDGTGYKNNYSFWPDICRYGWDSFKHEVLYSCLDSKTAHEIEHRLINEWNLLDPRYGYNLWDGKGHRSPASKGLIHESRLGNKNSVGRTLSDGTRAKISLSLSSYYADHDNPFLGKHHSAETIEKLRNRKISKETRLKMSKNHADVSGAKNPSARPVMQFTTDGEFIAEYEFAKQASDKYGIDLSSIIKCCRGKSKTAGGYVWKYATS